MRVPGLAAMEWRSAGGATGGARAHRSLDPSFDFNDPTTCIAALTHHCPHHRPGTNNNRHVNIIAGLI